MQNPQISSISNFIWNIADSVLRDHYMRGKYRDVILPMTVIRRLDAVLAPTKEVVLAEKEKLERSRRPVSRSRTPTYSDSGRGLLQHIALHARQPFS